MAGRPSWGRDPVVYQVYPRSFQDSDGDGMGDLRGVTSRLRHIRALGADAVWLSPFYPSPGADGGYDISDFTGVDPQLGTLDDIGELIAEAHGLGLRVLLDLVPNHTSIQHPWFRLYPERYVWSEHGPGNNWIASFGGPAWTRDDRTGRWYLHSFYAEQPDLDWRNPDVREAMGEVVRFWRDLGVDGFRVDAIQSLAKDPLLRSDPPAGEPWPLPLSDELARLDLAYSRGAPGAEAVLAPIRDAAGDALLVGEVYLPTARLAPYLGHLDAVFSFEFLHAEPDAERLATVIADAAAVGGIAWALSNHDFPRLASRFGEANARLAAMLLLTLPGPAFIYQGDEIGMRDGAEADPPRDRHGRDPFRTPMRWDSSRSGGFTTGASWLPPAEEGAPSVADQEDDPNSMLALYRRLIAIRPRLGAPMEWVAATGGVLRYQRGSHLVELNLSDDEVPGEAEGEVLLATDQAHREGKLAPGEGTIVQLMV